jgi:hypothetical protein
MINLVSAVVFRPIAIPRHNIDNKAGWLEMKFRAIYLYLLAFLLLYANFSGFAAKSAMNSGSSGSLTETCRSPVVTEMNIETKREIRKDLLQKLIQKYNHNNTFPEMHQYMITKYKELDKKDTLESPDQLISNTLDKSRSIFEKVKSFIGNSFKRQYNPVALEESVKKYLWLKGVCFMIMGINEEHKIAISYFYCPGQEDVKRNFMIDTVKYSFPEVQDIPENAEWFETMGKVMERLGYKLFNVNKYVESKNGKQSAPLSNE